jgi:hypothetical protein
VFLAAQLSLSLGILLQLNTYTQVSLRMRGSGCMWMCAVAGAWWCMWSRNELVMCLHAPWGLCYMGLCYSRKDPMPGDVTYCIASYTSETTVQVLVQACVSNN